MEKVSQINNPRQKDLDLQERCVHLCFSLIVSQTQCLFVHNTPSQQTSARVRKSAVDFQKCPLTGSKEPSQSCTPELPQEHAKSSWGAAPAPIPMALPTDAVHLPSHCSRPQARAVDTKLSYCDSSSSGSHDSQPCEPSPAPCHACLVVGLLQRRASSTCRKETSTWLSSPSPLCPGSCFPASR